MKWTKLGHIWDPTKYKDNIERPWMAEFSQSVSTLILENTVRVYFSCRPLKQPGEPATSYTTFLELNRQNLTDVVYVHDRPILELGARGSFDEHAVYPSAIFQHGNMINLYYAGWSRSNSVPFNCAIGMATSLDGVNFTRLGPGPILAAGVQEPFVISGPKVRKFNDQLFMFYLSGTRWIMHNDSPEIVYKIRMATSLDGINWTRLNTNIIPDILEADECQAGPDVFYYNGFYHMYFVYRYALDFRHDSKRGYRIGYAISRDLTTWQRADDIAGISYSDTGWDSTMMHYPHVFCVDGKHYMLYNGNEFGRYGFGLAELSD